MKNLYPYLTFAGAIPFLFCALCLASSIHEIELFGSIQDIYVVYSLIIVIFLTGSHWGHHLHLQQPWSSILAVLSNVIAVVLWLSYMLLPYGLLLLVMGIAYTLLLWVDFQLMQDGIISKKYFDVRSKITLIVLLTLAIVFYINFSN